MRRSSRTIPVPSTQRRRRWHQRREDAKDGLDEEDCGERNGQDASLLSVSRVSSLPRRGLVCGGGGGEGRCGRGGGGVRGFTGSARQKDIGPHSRSHAVREVCLGWDVSGQLGDSSLHAAEDEPPRIEQGGERENVQGRADDREGPASSVAGRHIEQRLIAQFKLDGESSEAGGDAAGEDVVGGVTADLREGWQRSQRGVWGGRLRRNVAAAAPGRAIARCAGAGSTWPGNRE